MGEIVEKYTNHKHIVEQKHVPLMGADRLLSRWIQHLLQSTVANQTSLRFSEALKKSQNGFRAKMSLDCLHVLLESGKERNMSVVDQKYFKRFQAKRYHFESVCVD